LKLLQFLLKLLVFLHLTLKLEAQIIILVHEVVELNRISVISFLILSQLHLQTLIFYLEICDARLQALDFHGVSLQFLLVTGLDLIDVRIIKLPDIVERRAYPWVEAARNFLECVLDCF
jgi:hypothetical protein